MSRGVDLYTDGARRRMEKVKRDAGYRCRACGRRRREHGWQFWRPPRVAAHHLFRRPGSPLWPLCERDHLRAHRFDKRSPLPLWLDTLVIVAVIRLARYAGWAALIALTVIAWKVAH